MVPRWTRGQDTAELVEYPGHTYGTSQRIVLLALSGNAPTSPEGITANVVVVNDFEELEKLGRDIEPMSKAGVPAFGIMQDTRTYFNYHHSAADTLDKVTPRLLQENAAAMTVMGFALADMPNLLPR
jgi:hypothetical protein